MDAEPETVIDLIPVDDHPVFPELQRIIDETKAEIAAALHGPKKMRARRRKPEEG